MLNTRPAAKVELSISCSSLIDRDVTSKSDPSCIIFIKDASTRKWTEIARTERIKNTLNPTFSQKIQLDYYFEEVQKLKFGIYDIDNDTTKLSDDDFLGKAKCTLGQIVSSKKYTAGLLLKKKQRAGNSTITVEAEEIRDNRIALMSFKAHKLDNKDFLGKSDPFLEIWRHNEGDKWTLAHRTEVIKNTLNPTWKPLCVPLQSLCGGDPEKSIKFIISDADDDGSHDLIGEFYSTFAEMQSASEELTFNVINPKKKEKKKYKNSGQAILSKIKVEVVYSFLDFIFGGLQLNFTVGIDFTGSNGDPQSPSSLHFMNPNSPNDYLQALIAVGNVIQDYDSDKLYPALGFGAKLPDESVSFEFALNFNPTNPYCAGIQGIVEAYKQAIPQIKLWGPTNIAPIINHVARFAAQAQSQESCPRNYFVLLLLTDGAITDMNETKQAIVSASHLPMSIIIVGVGPADFTAMNMLDGDDGVLKSPSGQPVARDIVQFVPYRDFKKSGHAHEAVSAALARAVLAEVPTQVVKYFRSKNMPPGMYQPQ